MSPKPATVGDVSAYHRGYAAWEHSRSVRTNFNEAIVVVPPEVQEPLEDGFSDQ